MAHDRFIYWTKRSPGPTLADVQTVLEDYLGDAATAVGVQGRLILAKLHGAPRFPFRRMPGYENDSRAVEFHSARWIEVHVDSRRMNIDVITRMADEYTSGVAEGFAALAARFWNGRRESE